MGHQKNQHEDCAEILELIEDYCDGLHRLDTVKLSKVFSSSAHYATIANGSMVVLTMDEYFPQLLKREAPADKGEPLDFVVTLIRFAGANTALVELECSLFGYDYKDLLSLLRIDGRWRIQAKIFEGVSRDRREVN
jgi:putative lumazine-binding protein